MGALLGISGGSQSGNTSSNGTTSTTYSPLQAGLQSLLGSAFSGLIPSLATGAPNPNVTAMQTQSADSINQTAGGLTDRMTRFLASRGFGQSGQTGKVALAGELGRESSLASNNSNFATTALNYGSNLLTQALGYAFNGMGQTQAQTGTSSGSGWGVGGGLGGSLLPAPKPGT
jgi:hypothetical protein